MVASTYMAYFKRLEKITEKEIVNICILRKIPYDTKLDFIPW